MKLLHLAGFLALGVVTPSLFAAGISPAFLGRGVVIAAEAPERNFADFAATGGNLVRIYFANRPLRNMTPPYEYNEQNFALLDHDLDICQKYNLQAIVDPHTFPGMEGSVFTTHAKDPLWHEGKYAELAIQLWTVLAKRLSQRGSVVAGYDLLNEPALPNMGQRGTPADWNGLAARIVAAIRTQDATHPVIIESPLLSLGGGRFAARFNDSFASYLGGPPDPNVVYSLHMYDPMEFTYQGVDHNPMPVDYPGMIDGEMWDASRIAKYFAPVLAFQRRYHVPIYIGELSSVRWSGDAGNRYLHDVIEYAEAHQWSWTYHEWRGADAWDAEKSNYSRDDHQRRTSTPRLELLKSYWKRGNRPS